MSTKQRMAVAALSLTAAGMVSPIFTGVPSSRNVLPNPTVGRSPAMGMTAVAV